MDADPGSSPSRRSSTGPLVLGGHHLPSDPSNGFLERATWFLIHSTRGRGVKDDKQRVTAYMSLAELGDAVGEALWSKPSLWSTILRVIREGIPIKGELPSEGVLECIEMAVRVTASQCHAFVGDEALVGVSTITAFENDLRGLVMLLVSRVELSESLVSTATKVIKVFPALSTGLREGLMQQLSCVLCNGPLGENEEGGESQPPPSSSYGHCPASNPPTPSRGSSPLPPPHPDSSKGIKTPPQRKSWLRGIMSPYESPSPLDRATRKSLPDSATPNGGDMKEKAIVLALGVLGSFDFYSSSAEEIAAEDDVSSLEAASMDRPAYIDHRRTIPRMFGLGFDLLHATCTNILHAEVNKSFLFMKFLCNLHSTLTPKGFLTPSRLLHRTEIIHPPFV